MTAELTLRLHGPFGASMSDGKDCSGLSRRGQAMLAYLSRQPDMRAERGLLASVLWSDRSEEQARASLRQELSVMRKALPQGIMTADRQFVRLDAARVSLAPGGDEFLKGFDLASEGFEDWLRAERMAGRGPAPAKPADNRARPGVAVLAFEDLSGRDDFFADGVVEEITGALSRVREFDVIARQSAFALRDARPDIPQVAAQLGVDYIVEGSVRRAGERVRIATQLVRGKDGHMLWSEHFDDRLDDLFDLQDRIAAAVAGQIAPSLRAAEIARARTTPPADRTAYELLLTALPHFWAHRKDENARAIALLDAALQRAPDYGPALAYRAWAQAQQPVYMWSGDPAADHAEALELAERAALDAGSHSPTLVAIGATFSLSSRGPDRAGDLIDAALAIDPNNAWGWMRRGWLANYTGDADTAIACFERSEQLSPLDPFRYNNIFGRASTYYRWMGRHEEAVGLIRRALVLNPGVT